MMTNKSSSRRTTLFSICINICSLSLLVSHSSGSGNSVLAEDRVTHGGGRGEHGCPYHMLTLVEDDDDVEPSVPNGGGIVVAPGPVIVQAPNASIDGEGSRHSGGHRDLVLKGNSSENINVYYMTNFDVDQIEEVADILRGEAVKFYNDDFWLSAPCPNESSCNITRLCEDMTAKLQSFPSLLGGADANEDLDASVGEMYQFRLGLQPLLVKMLRQVLNNQCLIAAHSDNPFADLKAQYNQIVGIWGEAIYGFVNLLYTSARNHHQPFNATGLIDDALSVHAMALFQASKQVFPTVTKLYEKQNKTMEDLKIVPNPKDDACYPGTCKDTANVQLMFHGCVHETWAKEESKFYSNGKPVQIQAKTPLTRAQTDMLKKLARDNIESHGTDSTTAATDSDVKEVDANAERRGEDCPAMKRDKLLKLGTERVNPLPETEWDSLPPTCLALQKFFAHLSVPNNDEEGSRHSSGLRGLRER